METIKLSQLIIICFALSFLTASCINEQTSKEWSQWRGPNRDGVSHEKNLLKKWPENGPELVWLVDSIGDGFSSAAIKGQMVYATGKRDSFEIITAMDLDGEIIWQKEYGRASRSKDWPQSRCTPTIFKDEVYVVTVFGDITCFDRENGEVIWEIPASEKFNGIGTDGFTESPLVFDDKMIITPCGKNTTMVALNRLTGETIWKSESIQDTAYFTSPVLLEGNTKKVVFTSTLHYDILVDYNTGEIIKKDAHISGIIPQVFNNQVYFTGHYQKSGSLCSYNETLTERSVIWQDSVIAYPIGGAVVFQGKLIVPGFAKGIYCIDAQTGTTLSYYDNMNCCNLMVADDLLYSYEDKMGRVGLFTLNENSLELVSSFKIRQGSGPQIAHMSLSNGLLFVRRGEVLMAYDIKQKEINT